MWGAWFILSLFSLGYAVCSPVQKTSGVHKDHRSFTKNIVGLGLGFFEGRLYLYPWNPENVRWQWKNQPFEDVSPIFGNVFFGNVFFQIKSPAGQYPSLTASGDHGGAPSPEWSIWRRGGAEALRWCLCGQKWAPGAMAAEVGDLKSLDWKVTRIWTKPPLGCPGKLVNG